MSKLLRSLLDPTWLNVYIGLYLATFPVLYAFPTSSLIIGVQIGTAVAIAGIAAAAATSKHPGLSLINVPVGLFMMGLPLLFGFAGFTAVLVQDISLGVLCAMIAIVGEVVHTRERVAVAPEVEERERIEERRVA